MNENENEKKAGTEQAVPPGTENSAQSAAKWKDYLKGRKNDLDVDNDDAVNDYLGSEFSRLDESDKNNQRMNDLIMSDNRNAGLLSGMMTGKNADGEDFDLASYIMQNWFDEIRESTTPEEAAQRINAKMADNEKAAAEEAKRSKEVEENFARMNEALGEAMQQTGVDGAKVQQVIDWLYGTDENDGLYVRIPKRTITADDFVKLIYAFTRDEELDKSKKAGVKEGRNSRPGASHRSAAPGNTDLGGGASIAGDAGTGEPEENPTAKRYGAMRPRFT